MNIKKRRQLISIGYHVAIITFCFITSSIATAWLSGLILITYALTFRINPLSRIIQEKLIREAECPACGEVIDLMQIWRCSCNFITWEERHAFSPCPNCKKVFSWVVCPICERSIPI